MLLLVQKVVWRKWQGKDTRMESPDSATSQDIMSVTCPGFFVACCETPPLACVFRSMRSAKVTSPE